MPVLSLERDSAFAGPGRENVRNYPGGASFNRHDVNRAQPLIDQGTMGKTWIQRGVKIENLVQIATIIGDWRICLIVAQVGISGSTKLGKGVILGGQAGLVGHINIGDYVMVGAQSGVHDDVPSHQVVSGSPHMPHQKWLRVQACVAQLPDMRKNMAALLKRVEKLEKDLL